MTLDRRLDLPAERPVTADLLRADPLLGGLPGPRLAALLAHARRTALPAGAVLFDRGDPTGTVYRLLGGEIALQGPNGEHTVRRDGLLGQEAVLGALTHADHARAVSDLDLLALPAETLSEIAATDTVLRHKLFDAFATRHALTAPEPAPPPSDPLPKREGLGLALGWLCAILAPLAILLLAPSLGLPPSAADFLAILAATVCMWLFGLVPEYVPPLFAALAVILLDVAPLEEALSGFRSESFFMCLSVFGLGTLMVSSGLTYRFALAVLARVPPTQLGYNAALFGMGTVLSPILPSVVGRVSIISPFVTELISISGAEARDRWANRLIYSLLAGSALLVPVFLTASVPNLVVYGLLDPQTQFTFDWGAWLWAASAYGAILLVGFVAVSVLLFSGARQFSLPRATLREQQRVLGPLAPTEIATIIAILTMTAGILSEQVHRVDFPWVALAIFVTLLMFGSLRREALRAQIDWPVLVYIGAILGWVPIAHSTGLDQFIIARLAFLGPYMQDNLPLFVLMVSGVILLVRLALPTGVTVVLFVTALFPLAQAQGLSLWVVGFVVLAVADTFVFPYQSSYFLKLRNDLKARGLGEVCDTPRIIRANLVLIVLRITALLACLGYWRALDLI